MTASVLLDTVYLISLVGSARTHHTVAAKYYRLMLDHHLTMYFSAIVAAEISIKQPITDFPLKNFRTVPFNIPHAIEAGRIWNLLGSRDIGDARGAIRDDVKLITSCAREHSLYPHGGCFNALQVLRAAARCRKHKGSSH